MGRKTRYLVKCQGTVIASFESYSCMELEAAALLATASKAAGEGGHDCMKQLELQMGVSCENLSVEAISGYDYDRVHGSDKVTLVVVDALRSSVTEMLRILEYEAPEFDAKAAIVAQVMEIKAVIDQY